mgnify:CR=1 FL=1
MLSGMAHTRTQHRTPAGSRGLNTGVVLTWFPPLCPLLPGTLAVDFAVCSLGPYVETQQQQRITPLLLFGRILLRRHFLSNENSPPLIVATARCVESVSQTTTKGISGA